MMGFMVVAFVLGGVIGLARGGRLRNLGEHSFTAWPLLMAGAVLQTLGQSGVLADGYPLILASYVLLVIFVLRNLRYRGMTLVMAGLLMNFTVIAVNSGMPVRASALRSLGVAEADIAGIDFKAKRHLEEPDDKLTFLGDIVPMPFPGYSQVLSVGDLVLTFGMAVVLAEMLQHKRRHLATDVSDAEPLGAG